MINLYLCLAYRMSRKIYKIPLLLTRRLTPGQQPRIRRLKFCQAPSTRPKIWPTKPKRPFMTPPLLRRLILRYVQPLMYSSMCCQTVVKTLLLQSRQGQQGQQGQQQSKSQWGQSSTQQPGGYQSGPGGRPQPGQGPQGGKGPGQTGGRR